MIEKLKCITGLALSLGSRDIKSRYKGSVFGWIWTLITPLLMLTVYTFIFGFVFKSRWGDNHLSSYDFSINLFIGMLFFGFFSECFTRAPSTIYTNTNYVKKLVFKLEILPIANLLSALFHLFTGLVIWLLMVLLVSDVNITVYKLLTLIVILINFSMLTLGITYYLSSIGTFIKDINQVCMSTTTLILFLSPVFYDSKSLPAIISNVILLNPISYPILEIRNVFLNGQYINMQEMLVYSFSSIFVFFTGVLFFSRIKKGFVDVV
ncbi:ABC transporter permease [Photobacterium chitinilyticum]|uniref:ABC transporter permease n=1 Tax=Photobacterium chitinilyticum TaxID=2485123 RepID=UPI003D0D897E